MTVYCLGDSLTYGSGVTRGQSWTALLEHMTNYRVINRGVTGDTTGGMLARLCSDVLKEAAYSGRFESCIVLMGGYNDIFYSGTDASARANLAAAIQNTLSEGLTVLVGIPWGLNAADCPEAWRRLVDFERAARLADEYTKWIEKYCTVFNIPFVDLRPDFEEDGKQLLIDGIHPNCGGHRIIAGKIAAALGALK